MVHEMTTTTILKQIETAHAIDGASTSVFSHMRDAGVEYGKSFLDECHTSETLFMEEHYPEEKHPTTGKFKFRTFLPKAYISAKSVVKVAIELNISLDEKSKSRLEKEIKSIKVSGMVSKSPYERAMALSDALNRLYDDLDTEEVNAISINLRYSDGE